MKRIFAYLLLFITSFAAAQNKVDTLTNNTIIQLKSVGMGSEVIKSKIQASICNFDLSTDGLIALKKAGIADDVMALMISKASSSTTTRNVPEESVKSVDPGIYYCKGSPCTLIDLEASVYSQGKTGSGILTAMTYGIAKTQAKATLSGPMANLQINETSPVFYFYFAKSAANSFGENSSSAFWFNTATSPNEFIMAKFVVTKKAREVVTGSWSTYSGMSSGIDDDNKVSFKYEKISPGVYRVYTEKPLKKGEYCFMYAGATASAGYGNAPVQKVYDFSIQ